MEQLSNILLFKAKAFGIEVSPNLCIEMNSFDATIIILCTLVELSLSHPEEKIVGGHSINITEAPYQVSFNIRETHFCGGALISASFVLSAAHCKIRKNYEKLLFYPKLYPC